MKNKNEIRIKKPITNRFLCLIFAVIVFVLGRLDAWALDGSTQMSEEDALRLGMQHVEIQERQDASLRKAESEVMKARTWVNPVFEYSRETSDEGPDDTVEQFFSLSQELDLSGRRDLEINAERKRVDAVVEDNAEWRRNRIAEIRLHFYEALYQQHLLKAFDHWLSNMDDIEEMMRKLKKGGEISGYDLRRLLRERTLVLAEQQRTSGKYERSLRELRGLIEEGSDPQPWSALVGSLLPEEEIRPLAEVLESLPDQPSLNSLKLQGEALAFEERAADRWWMPRVTVGLGMKDIDTGSEKGNGVFASLSFPIPVLDQREAERQRTVAQKRLLESEYKLALGQMKGAVSGLWQQAVQLEETARRVNSGDSGTLVSIAEAAYRAGEIGILEILDAYRSAFEEEAQFLALAFDARTARIELDLITGGLTQ